MTLTQRELNKAFAQLVAGNPEPWDRVLEAIRRDEVEVTTSLSALTLAVRAPITVRNFTAYLEHLRTEAGVTQLAIAEAIDVSNATVSRLFCGTTIANWPTSLAIINYLGGDPVVGHELFSQARAALRENSRR